MERVRLGKGGIEVGRIGLGMWQASGPQWGADVRDEDCIGAVRRSVDLGVDLVDTAEVYGDGHSEEVVGRAIRDVGRDRVVLATKVAGYHMRGDDVRRACEGSLKRLGVDAIDLYQVHWPDPWDQVPLRHGMKTLEKLQREGKIRAIGVSNFAVRDLEEARSHLSRVDIAANQVRYNLIQREIEEEVLPYCRREGIAVLAWSPLAQGVLADTYRPGKPPKDNIRKQNDLFTEGNLRAAEPLLAALRKVARAHAAAVPQVAIARLAMEPGVIPIPGAKRAAQAEENAGAGSLELTKAEARAIDAASRALRVETF